MDSIIIHFSDKSTVQLNEDDLIFPIVVNSPNEAGIGESVKLWSHTEYGLTLSFMDAICKSRFFYINGNHNVLYSTGSIIKIEVI